MRLGILILLAFIFISPISLGKEITFGDQCLVNDFTIEKINCKGLIDNFLAQKYNEIKCEVVIKANKNITFNKTDLHLCVDYYLSGNLTRTRDFIINKVNWSKSEKVKVTANIVFYKDGNYLTYFRLRCSPCKRESRIINEKYLYLVSLSPFAYNNYKHQRETNIKMFLIALFSVIINLIVLIVSLKRVYKVEIVNRDKHAGRNH